MDINVMDVVKQKIAEWRRVLKITRKPDREEFTMSAKVTGAAILLLGAIGFSIYAGATMLGILLRGGS
ncbi:MAG: protein translocase SEC61 complex subunit gamma [Candidatus Nanohaloarchaea archaeon]|nr:protein translocase SEC61 complex subunit gamma [Candidatus Nanohaloarchaea archaeon]